MQNGTCNSCPKNCHLCSSVNKCEKCDIGYYKNSFSCPHVPKVVQIVQGQIHVYDAILGISETVTDALNVRRHVKRVHPNLIALHVMMDLN
jgi:hypothetical protein